MRSTRDTDEIVCVWKKRTDIHCFIPELLKLERWQNFLPAHTLYVEVVVCNDQPGTDYPFGRWERAHRKAGTDNQQAALQCPRMEHHNYPNTYIL